ncbi:MAG: hypothetical protein RDV48_09800 [Candidatus Eremiobacteraeota bacterium]|nr:hypothetical protein [Candidatus Eremiobacteraeota bacterium]
MKRRTVTAALCLCMLILSTFGGGCGSGGATGGSFHAGGGTALDTQPVNPAIVLQGVGDSRENPLSSLAVDCTTTTIAVSVEGAGGTAGAAPEVMARSNRSSVAGVAVTGGNRLVITPLRAGRAGLTLEVPQLGLKRSIGLIVKDETGSVAALPVYLAIGSMDKDFRTSKPLWEEAPMDMRYIYLQGGFETGGWYKGWNGTQQGEMLTTYIADSASVGMIPVFVYYQIPGGGGDSAEVAYNNVNNPAYMALYFQDYVMALELQNKSSGKSFSLMILEPDFIGYMMQNYSGNNLEKKPDQISAEGISAVYTVKDSNDQYLAKPGEITGVDDSTINTVRGYVLTMNWLARKYAPKTQFGWKMNIWCTSYPGNPDPPPGNGIVHFTDGLTGEKFTEARAKVASNSAAAGRFYKEAGVTAHGAAYLFFDRYGIDAGSCSPWTSAQAIGWQNPSKSSWFWNLIHCNNYALFVKTAQKEIGLPAGLWQIPVGHINSSQTKNNLAWNKVVKEGELFPDLCDIAYAESDWKETLKKWQAIMGGNWQGDTAYGAWEDTMATYIFGDTFSVSTSCGGGGTLKDGLTQEQVTDRIAYFGLEDPDDPGGVTVSGSMITYRSHMAALKDSGVVMIMFGPGVGTASTMGTGWNDTTDSGQMHPQDWYWWINKVYEYYGTL